MCFLLPSFVLQFELANRRKDKHIHTTLKVSYKKMSIETNISSLVCVNDKFVKRDLLNLLKEIIKPRPLL